MHSLLEDVLPFVVVFYIAESVAFVGAQERLFVSLFGRFRALGEGLHLAALTPWAISFSCFEPEICWHVDRVVVGRDETGVVPFAAMQALTVDRHWLSLAPGISLKAPSPPAAAALRDRLSALRDAAPSERAEILSRQCAEAHDLEALRARLAAIERWSRRLRIVQTALFAAGFAGVPIFLYLREPATAPIEILVGLMLALFIATLALGYNLLRACGSGRGAAAQALSGFVLFPPGCLHMFALLGRPLLASFAPLTLAAALLPPDDFRTLARQKVRRLESTEAEGSFEKYQLQAVLGLIAARGLSREQVLEPPPASDATAVSYCPLCSEEYRKGFDWCAECGVRLEPVAVAAPSL